MERAIKRIYDAAAEQPVSELLLLGSAMLFLAEIARLFPCGDEAEYSIGRERVDDALEYIHRHIGENPSVDEIARSLGINRSYLYKLFIKHLGVPPTVCCEQIKINYACHLLRGRVNVQTAAEMSGYSSYSHFSHAFKKMVGCSPREYCKNVWKTD